MKLEGRSFKLSKPFQKILLLNSRWWILVGGNRESKERENGKLL
jgi:hypothetical protein